MTAMVLPRRTAGLAAAASKNRAIAVCPSPAPAGSGQAPAAAVIIVVERAAALEFVHRLVEVLAAQFVAHLLTHAFERARDAPGVVLVNVGETRRIGERVHPRFLAARRGKTRHQPAHPRAAAMLAHGLDALAHAHREHAGAFAAALALIFVDWHRGGPLRRNTSTILRSLRRRGKTRRTAARSGDARPT